MQQRHHPGGQVGHYDQQQRQQHSSNTHIAPNAIPQHYQQGLPSQRQGFNFRSHNQSSGPPNRPGQPSQQQSGAVNNNVMNSLKAQLKSTLKNNRDRR
jgi:hypothetical protein